MSNYVSSVFRARDGLKSMPSLGYLENHREGRGGQEVGAGLDLSTGGVVAQWRGSRGDRRWGVAWLAHSLSQEKAAALEPGAGPPPLQCARSWPQRSMSSCSSTYGVGVRSRWSLAILGEWRRRVTRRRRCCDSGTQEELSAV